MKRPDVTAWLGAALTALAVAAAAVALMDLVRGTTQEILVGLGVLLGAAVLGVCGVWLLRAGAMCTRVPLERYLIQLTALADGTLTQLDPPRLPKNDDVSQLLGQLHVSVCRMYHRLRELEHSRAATEVRVRRTKQQHERMEQIVNALVDPVLAVDGYNEVLVANPSARRLLKPETQVDTAARVDEQLSRCEELVKLLHETRRLSPGSQRSEELLLSLADEAPHWYRATAATLKLQGEIEADGGAVVVLRDITSLREAQSRHAEFVSAVSHEMKTPLASIKAYVELLIDGDAEDQATQESFLEVINSQADRLQRLIDNLLNLARIEAGVATVDKRPVSLNAVLEEAVKVMRPTAEQKGITLSTDLSQLYLGVHGDRDMLLQTAINLVSNALKYTREQGQVTVRSRQNDDQVTFEVEDTGVGLNPEDCAKVFEKFYRVRKDANMASGTGLGLSLVKHIVEDVHGGSLSVRSQLGVGSVFTVTLLGTKQRT